MTTTRFVLSICGLALVWQSCQTSLHQNTSGNLRPGQWTLLFDISDSVPGVHIPITLLVDSSGNLVIHNDGEEIILEKIESSNDSLTLKAPFFQTFLHGKMNSDTLITGYLHEPTRQGNYRIPFRAMFQNGSNEHSDTIRQFIYDATFSKGVDGDEYKAVAVIERGGKKLTGTFLTETGDYRYLQGNVTGEELHGWSTFQLACWDGAHLFYFDGEMSADSIRNGRFCSGIHWREPWEARADRSARLRDPDSLTCVSPGNGPFQFSVQSLNGDSAFFGQQQFRDAVTIVQLFGSWCPNCTDESIFFREMFAKYGDRGLHIIPVAFERNADPAVAASIVKEQFKELGIPYDAYLGKGKGHAIESFPMLNHVMSMPTSIFIDKKGNVRKIHTGFYGPGTGSYYDRYSERMDLFIQQLLSE